MGSYAWFAKTVHRTAKRTDDTTCRGAMERYPTPKATADLGHEQKLRGVAIKDHPYYAIKDCVPMPFNWNGTEHIKSMMANFKMVSAKYYNRYGIYTVQAAEAFQLTDVKPLNFKKDEKEFGKQ